MSDVPDAELKGVIADFLELGHVDNIVAMFRHESRYYDWTGKLLDDERFAVRVGVAVLFEELRKSEPDKLPLAIPSLVRLLASASPTMRGEAIGVLGLIGTAEAIRHIQALQDDPSPQVREMVHLVLEEGA